MNGTEWISYRCLCRLSVQIIFHQYCVVILNFSTAALDRPSNSCHTSYCQQRSCHRWNAQAAEHPCDHF